ncbi:MAG: HAMP domain-containing protein [Sphingomonadales bacterium]|nr:HAMP domain-containing protein [Sphingomonadales bacterium]MDE2168459.1 HAMP domain-containing protein [Sphingomonadales bacterium]
MALRQRFRPFNSAAFRFALVIAGIFALASCLLLGMVRHQVGHYAQDATTGALQTETRILLAHDRARLADEIHIRMQADGEDTFTYALIDPAGHLLAGSLAPGLAHAGWGQVMMVEHGPLAHGHTKPERLRTLGTPLPGGGLLLVATDGFDVDRLGGHMARFTIVWAISVTMLALLGGWVAGWYVLERLADTNLAIERIMAGRTDQRLPMIGLAPELDDLARNLNRMLDRIDGLMAGLRQVSTDVAHDLRTPLTRLRQMLEALQDQVHGGASRDDAHGEPATMLKAGVEAALAQTDQILGTFRAMLRLAQIEGGGRKTPFAPVDLTGLLGALVETYEPVASDRGDALIAQIGTGALHVQGDGELLAQLFANLIENALLHTPDGTRITVAGERRGGMIAVTVEDNGPGVTPESRPHLAERFYQADPSRHAGSAGLGLAIASAIAHLHEGRLDIEDAAPGLRVSVLFPA